MTTTSLLIADIILVLLGLGGLLLAYQNEGRIEKAGYAITGLALILLAIMVIVFAIGH